ncbi:MAG: hypothetical protein AAFX51_06720, partial [Cyanobacteria bacterium J06636_28]
MSGYTIRLSPNRKLTSSEINFHSSLRITIRTRKSEQSRPTENSSPSVDEAAETIVDDGDEAEIVTDSWPQVPSSGSDFNPNSDALLESARNPLPPPTLQKAIPGLAAVNRALDVNPNELIRFGKLDQLGILELKDVPGELEAPVDIQIKDRQGRTVFSDVVTAPEDTGMTLRVEYTPFTPNYIPLSQVKTSERLKMKGRFSVVGESIFDFSDYQLAYAFIREEQIEQLSEILDIFREGSFANTPALQ